MKRSITATELACKGGLHYSSENSKVRSERIADGIREHLEYDQIVKKEMTVTSQKARLSYLKHMLLTLSVSLLMLTVFLHQLFN